MKQLLYLSLIALLISCSGEKRGAKNVQVELPEIGANYVSWLDIFPNMEMVTLKGDNIPLFDFRCNFIVKNGKYYVIDNVKSNQVHCFNKDGEYLNSIGIFGRGENEYLDIADVFVEENGNVSIYSQRANSLLTYSPNGDFINKKELAYPTERFISSNGYNYHYVGTASQSQEYKLYATDNNGNKVGEYLPTPAAPAIPNLSTFTTNNNRLYLCPNEGNDIFELENGKILDTLYHFDFGEYNIPDEYYNCKNMFSMMTFLEGKTIVCKQAFNQNKDIATLFGIRQTGVQAFNPFIGLQNKNSDTWSWYNIDINNSYIYLPQLDTDYIYFMADPAVIKELGYTDTFPQLTTIDENSSVVFLRAKTNSIN